MTASPLFSEISSKAWQLKQNLPWMALEARLAPPQVGS
jgi:hypothetical protein